jgi:predicted nucleotidyltransferase
MKFGLSEETIEKLRGVFARYPAVERAVLYGSRAKGNFKPGSDIDLTLCGTGLTGGELAGIEAEIDDLLLPFAVDLSLLDELGQAELRAHVERVGVPFYERRWS